VGREKMTQKSGGSSCWWGQVRVLGRTTKASSPGLPRSRAPPLPAVVLEAPKPSPALLHSGVGLQCGTPGQCWSLAVEETGRWLGVGRMSWGGRKAEGSLSTRIASPLFRGEICAG
jgi:hypothetical protein